MTDMRMLEDHIAITHVIQQVARAFDEKLHDSLLPKSFTENARILYRLRGNPDRFFDAGRPCAVQVLSRPLLLDEAFGVASYRGDRWRHGTGQHAGPRGARADPRGRQPQQLADRRGLS